MEVSCDHWGGGVMQPLDIRVGGWRCHVITGHNMGRYHVITVHKEGGVV